MDLMSFTTGLLSAVLAYALFAQKEVEVQEDFDDDIVDEE